MPFTASGFYPDGLYAGSQAYCELGMPVGMDENHYMPMPQTPSQVLSRAVRDVSYGKIENTTEKERLPAKSSSNKLNASSQPYSPEKPNAGKGQVLSDELTVTFRLSGDVRDRPLSVSSGICVFVEFVCS